MAEFGLIAWVYELDPEGNLRLNMDLTFNLAAEIAAAYRLPLENENVNLRERRDEFARILESFISE